MVNAPFLTTVGISLTLEKYVATAVAGISTAALPKLLSGERSTMYFRVNLEWGGVWAGRGRGGIWLGWGWGWVGAGVGLGCVGWVGLGWAGMD